MKTQMKKKIAPERDVCYTLLKQNKLMCVYVILLI